MRAIVLFGLAILALFVLVGCTQWQQAEQHNYGGGNGPHNYGQHGYGQEQEKQTQGQQQDQQGQQGPRSSTDISKELSGIDEEIQEVSDADTNIEDLFIEDDFDLSEVLNESG